MSIQQRFSWRWQFSIRTALGLTLLVALLASSIALGVRQARTRSVVVGRLTKAGFLLGFRDEPSIFWLKPSKRSKQMLGDDFFRVVTDIRSRDSMPREIWSNLDYLPHLERVLCNDSEATDRALIGFAKSPGLRELYLGGTNITDKGVAFLQDSKSLSVAVFWDTAVTDRAVEILGGLPRLSQLYLQRTGVTDSSISALPTTLTELDLSDTSITDASVQVLSQQERLQRLLLRRTSITDQCCSWLGCLKTLRMLDLTDTHISNAAVLELKSGLPNCFVRHSH